MFDKRGACRLLVAIAASCVLAATAFAQSFPDRPVKLVTYYSAGSGPDLVIRTVAERPAKMWGQSVIVDNRPGGGGMVSINALKAAAPDGYTFGVSDNSVLVVYPLLNPSVPFQADKELTPMALWMNTPFYLVVSPQSPFRTAADLIAYARANPGKLSYGSPTGIGNPGHLGMEIFKAETGTNLVLIPYKTSQPMFADMATGRLDAALRYLRQRPGGDPEWRRGSHRGRLQAPAGGATGHPRRWQKAVARPTSKSMAGWRCSPPAACRRRS